MKYPVELEFTDYCWLKCKSCPNKTLENKSFITQECFEEILSYIEHNKDEITFIDISGIWDAFLHPSFCQFLDAIGKKLQWSNIDILLPTKWQSVTQKHIDAIKIVIDSGLAVNISVGIYSLNNSLYKELSGGHSLESVFSFMKLLKANGLSFSLELLQSRFNKKEIQYGKKLASIFECWFEVQWYHNYSWQVNRYSEQDNICTFDENIYSIEGFYCNFVPFIDTKWNMYSCNISSKQQKWRLWNIHELKERYPRFLDLVTYIHTEFLGKEKCFNCSFYKNYEKRKAAVWDSCLETV